MKGKERGKQQSSSTMKEGSKMSMRSRFGRWFVGSKIPRVLLSRRHREEAGVDQQLDKRRGETKSYLIMDIEGY